MKGLKTNKKLKMAFITCVLLVFAAIPVVQAVTSGPGSDEDPLVTQGYVDEADEQLKALISALKEENNQLKSTVASLTARIGKLETGVSSGGTQSGELQKQLEDMELLVKMLSDESKFTVLELQAGQKLIAGASAEIIVRSGKATAIASVNGGLADITAATGKDLSTGQIVPNNHLILVSRDDGRGIKAIANKTFVLFKGTYRIE